MKRTLIQIMLILCIVVFVSACGQSGKLYLADRANQAEGKSSPFLP